MGELNMMLEVSIKSISITDIGFVVFLRSPMRAEVIPLFMGPVEARAISMELMGKRPKRPMTHDLLRAVIEMLSYRLAKIEITEVKNETYFAKVCLVKKGIFKRSPKILKVDSRPSDAIALALRFNSPIYAASDLFDDNGIILNKNDKETELEEAADEQSLEDLKMKKEGFPKKVNEELGVYQQLLQEAIKEERFEDASKIRDKIEIIMQDNK